MKIYTKVGDNGQTFIKGGYVPKHNDVIECLGNLDELNSSTGLILCEEGVFYSNHRDFLTKTQSNLLQFGAVVSGFEENFSESKILEIEELIDKTEESLEPLKNFILPQGSKLCVLFHNARAVCRRTERSFSKITVNNPNLFKYINRLSDLFFVLARRYNELPEVIWAKDNE